MADESASKKNAEHNDLARFQGKYLTFHLAGEEYGIEILKVREIIGMMDITKLPKTPPFVKGVINLRGKVIPIIDLRLRFRLEESPYTEKTCVIVVEIATENGSLHMGVIVDAVSEVLNVMIDDIEPKPNFGLNIDMSFIHCMAKGKGSVKTLLDIDNVIASEDLAELSGGDE